ncbi:hypothetical protein Rleg10DRAFT_4612 [Rhizobium leguminosarum bv. trifolii WSM2012]|nr:hypothetical protein Rleg10DRAFT_4612 [Rhizobium leguminosarum bv. trifolii WSM2012]
MPWLLVGAVWMLGSSPRLPGSYQWLPLTLTLSPF